MGNFSNNFSDLILLANKNITIKHKEEDFEFDIVPMKMKDILFDENIGLLLTILDKDIEELSKMILSIEIKNHYSFIRTIVALSKKREETKKMANSILKGLSKIVPDMVYDEVIFKIKDRVVSNEIFEEIIEIIYKIMEKEKILAKESDDEFTKREKAIKLRAQRIKNNGKNKKEESGSNFKDIIASIIYEFPQYKVEDLFELNIYTFNYLTKYIGKIANYEVSKIAAGNGLTKKHKYFIEK